MDHRETDRVPIDFSGHRSSGISAIAYAGLRKVLGMEEKVVRVYDPIQQLAVVDHEVLELFGVDTIELGRGFALDEDSWAPWTLPDQTPCLMPIWALPERAEGQWVIRSGSGREIARMPDGALYFEQSYFPFAAKAGLDSLPGVMEEGMWTAVASPPGPLVEGDRGDELFSEGAKKLRENTDRAVL